MPGKISVRLLVLGASAWLATVPAHAQMCNSDAECDDLQVCNGLETCDLTGGPPGFCVGGTPIVCDDNDPCTIDFCQEPSGSCSATTTPDGEAAAGPDGICDTADDNLGLFGPDGACGTADDLTGDGLCDLQDNCDLAHNPGQEDADGDGIGDACDSSPCKTQGLYTFSGTSLYRVDPSTGEAIFVVSGLSDPKDVVADPNDTQAVVTGYSSGIVYTIDLEQAIITNAFMGGIPGPWGVDLGSITGQAYVTARDSGELYQFDLFGGAFPITSGLSNPTGLAVNAAEDTAYVAEESTGEISSVDLTTGMITLIASGLSNPVAVALDPSENDLYVVEQSSGQLTQVVIATGVKTIVAPGLFNPQGLALDADGAIGYVTDQSTGFQSISAVDLNTGVVTPIPQDPMDPFQLEGGVEYSPPPPTVLSIPAGSFGAPAASVVVPFEVDDIAGLGVLSADFTVKFNPAVIVPTAVNPGTLTGACTLTGNLGTPGEAVVSVFCSADLAGAGSIAEITFNVLGTPGQESPLVLESALLNEGTPPVCADSDSFFVPVDISGRIVYYRDDVTSGEPSTKPVDAASVRLDRIDLVDGEPVATPVTTLTTGCTGDFALGAILDPLLRYRITPGKIDDYESAVDPFDASLNAQHVVGLITLTANQVLAADVTGNGTLTSFDSARIAQFSVGSISQFPVAASNGSDWAFVPVPQAEPNQSIQTPLPGLIAQPLNSGFVEYSPIVESAENQDFHAILFGDVSGNWTPVCGSPATAPEAAASFPSGSVTDQGGTPDQPGPHSGLLTLPNLSAAPGEEIRVPIRAVGAAEAVSFLLDLRYDPAVLEPLGAERGGDAAGFQLESNLAGTGRARLALFSAGPLGRDGEIVTLTFRVVGGERTSTPLTLFTSRVNEGKVTVKVREGKVMVLPDSSRR